MSLPWQRVLRRQRNMKFRKGFPTHNFYLEKYRWWTTAKVDARMNICIYLYAYTCSALGPPHARKGIHARAYYTTYVGTRIEMEWDFSSIYSSCERMPTYIRCYLPFVPSRLTASRVRAIARHERDHNVKKGADWRASSNAFTACSVMYSGKICSIEKNQRWRERADASVNNRFK